jgi:hypothetical protein
METKEIKVSLMCCNKPMKKLEICQYGNNMNDCKRFICLECGAITDIIDYALDDEELLSLLEDEELTDCNIYKELK